MYSGMTSLTPVLQSAPCAYFSSYFPIALTLSISFSSEGNRISKQWPPLWYLNKIYNNVTSVFIFIGCWPWSIKGHTHRCVARQIHVSRHGFLFSCLQNPSIKHLNFYCIMYCLNIRVTYQFIVLTLAYWFILRLSNSHIGHHLDTAPHKWSWEGRWCNRSNTRKSVSSGYPNPEKCVEKRGRRSSFLTTSRCLDILMKHSSECLI